MKKLDKDINLINEFDVAVLGGGPSGVSAAVAASRAGAKTILIERYGYLGGQATGGLVILLVGLTDGKERIIKGICQETIDKLKKIESINNVGINVLFDPESMKLVFDSLLEENNITPYYHSFISEAFIKDEVVSSVVISTKSGKKIIKAKTYIDATGDADLAKYCDIPFIQEDNENLQPVTLGFRVGGLDIEKVNKNTYGNYAKYAELIHSLGMSTRMGGWIKTLHKNEAWFNISHSDYIDATNPEELTRAEIKCRKQIFQIMNCFKKNIEGFENGYLIDTAAQIGVRDTRRIIGNYILRAKDVNENFEDTIAKAPNYTGSGSGSINVPYRCLISPYAQNLIFTGRCISVEHKIFDMIREIPCCMATGQAAGIAAALASKAQGNVHDINIPILQDMLISQGAFINKPKVLCRKIQKKTNRLFGTQNKLVP